MVFFHEILLGRNPLQLPEYLNLYDGNTGLRSTHLDTLSYVSSLNSRNTGTRNLEKSFFFRSHTLWNSLPFNVRSCSKPTEFKDNLISYFWEQAMSDIAESEDEGSSTL